MKTKTINLYQFSELSEEVKEKAINKLSDINVDYNWWDSTYEDAENAGLKLTEFDLDRNRHVCGTFITSALECSAKIIQEHGQDCETHKTALEFSTDWDQLVEKYSDGIDKAKVTEENESVFDDEANDLEQEFLKSILEDYSIILQKECEYLQSEKAIIETIEANEYWFDENGNLD